MGESEFGGLVIVVWGMILTYDFIGFLMMRNVKILAKLFMPIINLPAMRILPVRGLLLLSMMLTLMIQACSPGATITAALPTPTPTRTQILLPTVSKPTHTPTALPEPTSTPSCMGESGNLVTTSYEGVVSEGEIPMFVHLPPCYDLIEREYPVLYLLHGYPLDESHWLDLRIVEIVEGEYSRGHFPHFLIVLPRIPGNLNVSTDGGEGSYEQEFVEGVMSYIEENYRVMGGAETTALAGVSRGGVWSLEIGIRNADLFGIVAALSPALHVNHPRPAYDPLLLVRDPINRPERLFISAGLDEEGFHQKIVEFIQLLETLGIPHTYLETPGAHENSTWIGIMGDFVEFITRKW